MKYSFRQQAITGLLCLALVACDSDDDATDAAGSNLKSMQETTQDADTGLPDLLDTNENEPGTSGAAMNLQAQVPDLFNPPVPDPIYHWDGYRDFITPNDASTFVNAYYDEYTTYWHTNDDNKWEMEDVWMFQMDLGHTTIKAPFRDTGEYTAAEAFFWTNTFGKILGQMPAFMLQDLDAIYFHDEPGGFSAQSGAIGINTHDLRAYFQHEYVEEVMLHELAHASIQREVLAHESVYRGQMTNWWDHFAALDGDYVGEYAKTNRFEDLASSVPVWLFNKFRPDRDYKNAAAFAAAKIPYRIYLLEDLNTRFNWNASW